MRIIGGNLRGKRITPPANYQARPTTDFAKEGLFNMLANEFDFSDAAATEFDIGTAVFDGFFTCGFRTDHFVNFRQGTDGAEIYVFPKHKRPHQRIEIADGLRKVLFTSKNATVDNASFEPGKAFPVATLAVEILFKHCRGNHQGTAVTKRTQTHVHAFAFCCMAALY